MAAVTILETPNAPVAKLATEAVMEYGSDGDGAADALLKKLRTEYPAFYKWKADRAMRDWCFEQIRAGRSTLRRTILDGPKGLETNPIQPLNAGSLAALATLYDWPLITGLKLGDGRRSDIMATRVKYDTDADIYQRRSTFLKLVAEALPNERSRVRDVLSLKQMRTLAQRAGLAGE